MRIDSEEEPAPRFMSELYREPRDVDPKDCADFTQALTAGEQIILYIDHTARFEELSSFIRPGISSVTREHEFLKTVLNVLYVLLTRFGVGLHDPEMLRCGTRNRMH